MSGIMQFLLIFLIASLACVKVTLQGAASRRYIRCNSDSLLYNSMFFACVALFLGIMFPQCTPNGEIALWGCIVGAGTVMFQAFYALALTSGPLSISSLVINLSVLVPTIVSAVVFRENIYYMQLAGIVLLCFSLPLSLKDSSGEHKVSAKWLIFLSLAFLSNGVATSLMKLFFKTESALIANSENTFLLCMYICASLVALAVFLVMRFGLKAKNVGIKREWKLFAFIAAMGLSLALFQKTHMYGLETIPGSLMFPTYIGIQTSMMSFIGILFFGDMLTGRQKLGIVLGIASVVLLNIKVGSFFVIGG